MPRNRPKREPIQAFCKHCDKVFTVRTNSKGNFCSQECKNGFRWNRPRPAVPRKDKPFYIYALREKPFGGFRYIGVTNDPKGRYRSHLNDKSRCHRANWIRSVLARGGVIEMVVLKKIPFWADPYKFERMWVIYGYERGWNLTNGTLGGEGAAGLSAESREKIRKAWIGRKHTEETKRKIGLASKGRRHSAVTRKKMSDRHKGRVFSEQHRKRISEAISGVPNTKRKISVEQAIEIKRRYNSGESRNALAAEFGINPRTVWVIGSGRWCPTTYGKNKESGYAAQS